MAQLWNDLNPVILFPILCILCVAGFAAYYCAVMRPRPGTLEWLTRASRPDRVRFSARCYPMERKDALPLLLVTAVYAFTAFFHLGSLTGPQSWYAFEESGTVLKIDLGQDMEVGRLEYFSGVGSGKVLVEVSLDGESYQTFGTIDQEYNKVLKWQELYPGNAEAEEGDADWQAPEPMAARYLRLTCQSVSSRHTGMYLGEVAVRAGDGTLADGGRILQGMVAADQFDAMPLFDEQDTVPDRIGWENSAYFDEIYHPRTAYEFTAGDYPYEVSHPPLGKLIMALGIQLFGMTPFGWRFMGALFGVGMLPILYVFLKNLFGKTAVALCGTALFAFDFMHFSQTRLATIDTYGVFFLLCLYFFLYRWMAQAPGTPFRRSLLPLFLAGLSFGLGCASKWTVVYGTAGAVILYFLNLWTKGRDWKGPGFGPWAAKCVLWSVVTFVAIPAVIYTASYIPYAAAAGDLSLANVVREMVDNQRFMFTYHAGEDTPHPYSSRWYQWIFDARPILYFRDMDSYAAQGLKSAIAAMGSPLVCWLGLVCLVIAAVQMVRRRCGRALFLVTGYCSQLLPWLLITRTTFNYHYFPSILFLVLLICYAFNDLMDRRARGWRLAVYGMTAGNTALFAAFYPVLAGAFVPTWYTANFLRWFPAWPF